MSFYADSSYPVRSDLESVHQVQVGRLGTPGTWGTGAQRLAVAVESRKASYAAGMLEATVDGEETAEAELPPVARRVIHKLAVAPKDVDEDFYNQALEDGLSDAEYVEIVGIVARMTNFDVFARGIGVSLRPLPKPESGQPSQQRPPEAVTELAWVPTVPNGPQGGETGKSLFEGNPKSYIVRGLSLVPDELRAHVELEEIQYLPLRRIREWDYQHHEGLTRPQVEVVAARISAINECFF